MMMANFHHRSLRGVSDNTSDAPSVIVRSLSVAGGVVLLLLIAAFVCCWRQRRHQCAKGDGGILRLQRTAESITPEEEASVSSENSQSLVVEDSTIQINLEEKPNPRRWWSRKRQRPPKPLRILTTTTIEYSQKPPKRRKRQSPDSVHGVAQMERSNGRDPLKTARIEQVQPRCLEPSITTNHVVFTNDDANDGIVRSSEWEKRRKAIALVIHAQKHPESYA